jgi:hypothetical protein
VTFSDVTLTGLTSETYTLSFVDTGAAFTAVTSNVSLSGLHIPSSPGEDGTDLASSESTVSVDSVVTMTVVLRDRFGTALGNDSTGPARVTGVTFMITQGPADAVLSANPSGTSVLSPAQGTGVFTANLISPTLGNVVVSATIHFAGQPSVALPSTVNINILPSALVQSLTVRTHPVGAGDAEPLAVQPVVELRDGSGNVVTSDNSTEVRAILRPLTSGSSASLNMSCRPAPDQSCRLDTASVVARAVNGVVTFDRIVVDGELGEAYVLEFTEVTISPNAPVFRAITSDPFSLTGALDAIREDLRNILYEDLREVVEEQQEHFNDIAAGALERLQQGEGEPHCGDLVSPDLDGMAHADQAEIVSTGRWHGHMYNCVTNTHRLYSGAFELGYTLEDRFEFDLTYTVQQERFVEGDALRGWFMGGYAKRDAITGSATGTIDGLGINGGVYGAPRFGEALFLDYYAGAATGFHPFDLRFPQTTSQDISVEGEYYYGALLGGAALSGQHAFEHITIAPRVGFEFARAWSSDAKVSVFNGLETGRVYVPDYEGVRVYIEPTLLWDHRYWSSNLNELTLGTTLVPSISCRRFGVGGGWECSQGIEASLNFANIHTGQQFSVGLDYSFQDPNNEWRLDFDFDGPILADFAIANIGLGYDSKRTINLSFINVHREW